jgi:hypothetical protein
MELKKKFKRAYGLRSAILHQGKIPRTREEIKTKDKKIPTLNEATLQMGFLSLYLQRAIAKEVQLWHESR